MAFLNCEQSPVALLGGAAAFAICDAQTFIPVEKIELKLSTKKTDVTSTASYSNGIIYDTFSPGSTGGEISFDAKWFVASPVIPPNVRQGAIYPVWVYTIRPGVLAANDPGKFYQANLFIDSNSISIDPRNGTIEWKVAGTTSGAVSYIG